MNPHNFILSPQLWTGEGKISLSMVEEQLAFVTRWNVSQKDTTGRVQSIQEIQIDGLSENMRNDLAFYDFNSKNFVVEMENLNIGRVVGTGVYDDKLIAWEFRENELNFEGFETYFLQEDGSYIFHAEYVTSDQFRTCIDGKIWKIATKEEKNVEKNNN
ncbi:MAG: hypothetical protein JW769_00225 [Parachlamydiales bacterium]|nr:hypothetical protein [Parachlamydiales bacterium]